MAETYTLYRDCQGCDGNKQILDPNWNWTEGNQTRPMVTCPKCSGSGIEEYGNIDEALDDKIVDLSDKVDDCLDKLDDILEKLNTM